MKQKKWILLSLLCLPVLLLACTLERLSTPTSTPTPAEPQLTITGIQQDYAAYTDKLVRVRGYGIIEMTMPLCPGYVGMDKRMVFVGEAGDNIVASLRGDIWEEAVKQETLRDFLGYVRVFSGEIGCPGSTVNQTIPYFEIVEVR